MLAVVSSAQREFRQRLSSVWMLPAPKPVDNAILGVLGRMPSKDFAPAPPGSNLRPVPGDHGPPLFGHFPEYLRYGGEFSLRRYERYGPVSWMGGPGMRFVLVGGPEATQIVLTNKDKTFSNEAWTLRGSGVFFRRGLLHLDFDEHRYHRRIMQPAFTSERLAGYVDLMSPAARETVTRWPSDRTFRLYYALKQLTLDVATRAFMNDRSGPEAQRINAAFVATVRGNTALVMKSLPGSRWRAALKGREVLERYFEENLPAKRNSDGNDLFSALCQAATEDGERFTDEDIINHMIFMMMAAHDTATVTTSAVAYYLAKHPEWQEKARQQSLELGDDPLDFAATDKLEILDLVLKESMRLLSPIPVYLRTAVRDTDILGFHIPAGTHISVAPQLNHFAPECWTDPARFDPARFGPDRQEDRTHKYAWIPFGMGAHKCIGLRFSVLEVKVMLHEMLRNYRWALSSDYQVRWDHTSLPVPSNGLPVRLTRL